MPTVTCPNHECGKSYNVSEESLGGRARCKTCGSVIELTWGGDESEVSDHSADGASSKSTGSTHSEARQLNETEADVPKASGQSQIPETLGRFQIRSVLGAGTFGTVYRAYDPQLDREVALKVPNVGVLRTEEEAERFLREARAAASLRHPNICPVYEANEKNGRYCIVMAFISGKTLSSLITPDKPLSERQVVLLVQKLSQALDLAHKKGVIHRDLKPGNIMFDQEHREPVIMDFGLARRAASSDAQMTQEGQILGTPAYMSPEQAMGQIESIGPASDVYSLGVIFYELLCCARPFPGTAEQVRAAHYLKTAAEPPSTHRPGIDPTLEAICMKAMSREIADRSSMAELAHSLTNYLRGTQQAADVLGNAQTPPPRRPAATSSAAGEVGLSALFAAAATDNQRPPAIKPKKAKRRKQPTLRKSYWQLLPPVGKWGVGVGAAALLILLGVVVLRYGETRQEASRTATTPAEVVLPGGEKLKLVLIPPGEFLMGSLQSEVRRRDDEQQHEVQITRSFYLGTTEVTQKQWLAVMGTRPWSGMPDVNEGDNVAATYVSWEDAQEFCRNLRANDGLDYRLPTEAEWEYACRAGTQTAYSFGDDESRLDYYAWFGKNAGDVDGQKSAHTIGQKWANAWGLNDMHGNVHEWCADWYNRDYYKNSPVDDPVCASPGSSRVDRGGGWGTSALDCRSAYRGGSTPSVRSSSLGFRVARSSVK